MAIKKEVTEIELSIIELKEQATLKIERRRMPNGTYAYSLHLRDEENHGLVALLTQENIVEIASVLRPYLPPAKRGE